MNKIEEYIDSISGEKLRKETTIIDGQVTRIEYRNSFRSFHRCDGPSDVIYRKDGKKIIYFEQYGLLHNPNGPAHMKTDANNEIIAKEYYLNGTEITDPLQLAIIQAKEAQDTCKSHY